MITLERLCQGCRARNGRHQWRLLVLRNEMIDTTDSVETTLRLELETDGQESLSWFCHVFLRYGDGGCNFGKWSETYSGPWAAIETSGFALKFDNGKLAGKTILGTVDSAQPSLGDSLTPLSS